MNETMKKLRTGRTLNEFAEAAGLTEEARAVVATADDGPSALAALLDGGHPVGAIGLLAHALPKREGVFWAFTCARGATGDDAPEATQRALEVTRAWIAEPTDTNRRAAFAAAQEADLSTPAGCVGAAAFFCGDSLGPPDQPAVPPEEFMAAKAIAATVTISALANEPDDPAARFRALVEQGLVVAGKAELWSPPEGG